jgi:hypothetical protein
MNQRNRYQAFVRAAETGDAGRIVAIVRTHPELHTVEGDEGGLLSVLYHSAPHLFEAAFAAGLSPDSSDVLTIPLLHQAAADGNESLVALALRYGADVERRSKQGESALGYAIFTVAPVRRSRSRPGGRERERHRRKSGWAPLDATRSMHGRGDRGIPGATRGEANDREVRRVTGALKRTV